MRRNLPRPSRSRASAIGAPLLFAFAWVAACSAGSMDSGGPPPLGPAPDAAPSGPLDAGANEAGADATLGAPADGGPTPAMTDASSVEASLDASLTDGAAACTPSVAIVGGTVAGASTIAFASTQLQGGGWATTTLPTNVASPPALVPFGDGFAAVYVDVTGALQYVTSSWGWSSPVALSGATAAGAPSLALVGGNLEVVYRGTNAKFFHGSYAASGGWDSANDPVGGAAKQGFGPAPPVAEALGGALVIAYAGNNGSLYDETWSGGAWQPDTQHTGTSIGSLAPAIAALRGGPSDTLIVYANPAGTLYATSRAAGVWSTPAVIDATAYTNAAPSLLALEGGRALLAYLGTNGLPYYDVYDPAASPAWTAPAPLDPGGPVLASPPSLAPGQCGDDAIAALTQPAGVAALRYRGGAWSAPSVIPGTAGMTFASVSSALATTPGPGPGGASSAGDGGAASSPSGTVAVTPDGAFAVRFGALGWTFSGNAGAPATSIAVGTGTDAVGAYHDVTFAFADTSARSGAIRIYDALPAAVFTETYGAAASNAARPFPTFTAYPALPYHVTYGDTEFAPVSFGALTSDSPFVFFDANADAFVLSAASDFMNASIAEDATGALASGIDPAVSSLPAGFSHSTVLVARPGINAAFGAWGNLLTSLSGKTRIANDGAPYLAKLGYFTDNGAYYYYQYDTATGYPATLEAVSSYFTGLGAPLGYMQLDSWWYPKGASQAWDDKADGQYTYTADPTVLPSGLASFQSALGLPLVTHARWIDPSSPYRTEYAMSKNVAIDPAYWQTVATELSGADVAVYEQDWLNQNALPVTSNLNDQAAFMDQMASAMAAKGIDLQYCMPLPRHYLQGSKYANLTTTRVSVDRFSSPRYEDFFYVSLLTSSLGAWPWSDTFNSSETENLLLSTLSAGMVGVGDENGTASASNLLEAVRPDGVIVKPDAPIVPIDDTFLAQAQGVDAPLVAATYTDFGGMRASYVFAYALGSNQTTSFQPASLGYTGKVFVYDDFAVTGSLVDAAQTYSAAVGTNGAYFIVAPVGMSGIAFLGDSGKFVALGKKRIPTMTDDGTLAVAVSFAAGETSVTLHGYAPAQPTVTASAGTAGTVTYDATTGIFSVLVSPSSAGAATLTLAE